ncbi:MAG: ABC transporter substrate-binding protein [Deltaproteobacteria bacterium]|nr:ABC transporter substrate-binding protein [Deltaproteobacteria bacterium]MBW2156708.1 ABC transporter substrate-binding protein [Deltaproteobacteria bacterium]MBW2228015.1 ABC transporter substrate-binding protein [Deltaproteobacteria bacterium]
MKNKQALLFVGLVLALALVFSMTTTTAMAENIRIGVAAPYTGNLAAYGDNIKAGVNLKLKEINDAGGINGQKVELVWGDDLCQPKDAGTVGSKFAADKSIVAVIGHLCSSATLAAMPIYVRAGLPTISPTSTNPTIGDVGKGWFFRNCYTDDFQGNYLASYVVPKLLGKKKVAIFYENNDYAIGLKNAFVEGAKNAGVTVTGAEAYTTGTTDFTPQLTKLLKDKPETIFLCGYHPEGALIAGQSRKLGFTGPLFGGDGIDNEDYIKIGGKAADNTYCTVPFLAAAAGPAGKNFAERYKKAYDRDVDWMSANAYDCLGILAQVIAKTGPDRKKIRDGLAAINSKANGYKGITGLTYFDKKGDCSKPAFVKLVKNGKFVAAE